MILLDRMHAAPVTMVLIAINVLIFLIETAAGGSRDTEVALKFGAQFTPLLKQRQYFRIIASMFLHFGFMHLLFNMYALFNIGPTIERIFGSARYLLIYLGAGIAGNLFTWFLETRTENYRLSAGASGAVFGLMGAYLVLALMPGLKEYFNLSNILINIGINVAYGLQNRHINMAAHGGGLVGGAVISYLLILLLRHG
ncbi:MAG: rhomboid family intramembrane serine protease [Lachnospiraceae bacterium]|nr:rhomboid family intramembrane serine protease [Lachnospiraceae bacterium]